MAISDGQFHILFGMVFLLLANSNASLLKPLMALLAIIILGIGLIEELKALKDEIWH